MVSGSSACSASPPASSWALRRAANPAHPQQGCGKNSPQRLALCRSPGFLVPPPLMADTSALLHRSPCTCHPTFSRRGERQAFPSSLAGCASHAGWGCAFLKCSDHPTPDHAHPCPETCGHQPRFPPLSHPPAPFWCSPSSSHPTPVPAPCRPLASPVTEPAPSGSLRLDAVCPWGQGRPLSSRLALGARCAALACRQLEEIRGAGYRKSGQRQGKEKKESWDLARSCASFHEKSNVAITGPRPRWSPPRPLPGSAALPMPTQPSAGSQPSLVLCPRLRRLRRPLVPAPPGGNCSQAPGEPPASCCSRDIFIAISIVF